MAEKYSRKININCAIQIILFVVLIAFDQFTKYLVVQGLKDKPAIVLIPGVLELQYLENTGAAFGILKDRQWIFYIITVVIVGIVIFFWWNIRCRLKKYCRFCSVCPQDFKKKTFNNVTFLSFILVFLCAGAIGNLIDRVLNKYVVDFIYFRIIDFPLFNFADICVTLSAMFLIIFFLFIYKEDPNLRLFNGKESE